MTLRLSNERSYWKDSTKSPRYAQLQDDIEVDVAIIGGGIAGLTAAYLLKRSGLRVAVLEKNALATGTTGGTTGKVTSQHGLFYADLVKRLGKDAAKMYAQANQSAINSIEEIIQREAINCDWRRNDNYIYTTDPTQIERFRNEAKVAKSLGLPASFETTTDLPLPVVGAVKFANQAQFHARKYVLGLAKAVHGKGSFVFEHSNVRRIKDGTPARVQTGGGSVTAKDIIVASKIPPFPLVARFSYALMVHPHTSYIVAGKYEEGLKGMYISPDHGQYSILPVDTAEGRLLLVGGQNHTPGLGWPKRRYNKLAKYARKHFGVGEISYHWKAMDYIAYDDLSLVGKLYPWSKHVYVATGFKKWGLTTSMVAGVILRDHLTGQPNPSAKLFDSTRVRPILSIPSVLIRWVKDPYNAALFLGWALLAISVLCLYFGNRSPK